MFGAINTTAFVSAFVVFFCTAVAAWVVKRYEVTDSAGLLAILLLPLATYGVASGYVSKFSAPGGWAAEFRSVARARIEPTRLVEEIEDVSIIEKAGLDAIQRYRESLVPGRPVAVSLRLGRPGAYSPQVIAEYIRAFITFDPNLTVIFVEDASNRFVASSNGASVLAALDLTEGQGRFLRAMEDADVLDLRRLLVLTTSAAREATTNAEALQIMVSDGVGSLVKVDDLGRPAGIVRRDEIVSRLMLKLATE